MVWVADSKRRIVTNDTLDTGASVPAALNLPPNQLFFGFRVQPYAEALDAAANRPAPPTSPTSQNGVAGAFAGGGNTLSGRNVGGASSSSTCRKGKGKAKQDDDDDSMSWGSGGQTLGSSRVDSRIKLPLSSGSADIGLNIGGSMRPGRVADRGRGTGPQRERSLTSDFGVDSDDEVIYVDSD